MFSAIFFVVLGLKILYALHFRIDSDEPQHLHVVWGWTQGMIPYRDLFDNHSPLFQWLAAPAFKFFGERADIIVPMRMLMIILFLGSVFLVFRIFSSVHSLSVGLWSAVFTASWPKFFFVSTEFRPDDLWTLIWLGLVAVSVRGTFSARRALFVGLLLGTAFSVSMKTLLMLTSLVFASAALVFFRTLTGEQMRWRGWLPAAASLMFGMIIVPGMVVSFFAAHGALAAMYYCIIEHNLDAISANGSTVQFAWFGAILVPILLISFFLFRTFGKGSEKQRLVWLLLVTCLYWLTLKSFWPIVTAEDYLPLLPLSGGIIVWLTCDLFCAFGYRAAVLLPVFPMVSFVWMIKSVSPFNNATVNKIEMVRNVLRLTDPLDYVMDAKGETIFRRRPFYYVFEGLTGLRLKAGMIEDTVPERLIETRAPLATLCRMPARAKSFISQNYLPIAYRLSALGKLLGQVDHPTSFCLEVAGNYSVVSEADDFRGAIDDKPLAPTMYLGAGRHEVRRFAGSGSVAILWSRAAEEGFSPFHNLPADRWTAED
ncbi:MAG: glycosyltransferase family 39 protein [Verrucomicrobia bacterium]|nr:glycosyltransferase family 39 protein [Verrucomicrobiota bacterium]